MLYVHCGWPRTGTSSLQAVLSKRVDLLATGGLVYPERLNGSVGLSQSRIYDLLDKSLNHQANFDDLKHFLGEHRDRDVLFSAEGLSNWLLDEDKHAVFVAFLAVAEREMPTTCIWTLRRIDDVVNSLYLLAVRSGVELPAPDEAIARGGQPQNPFDLHRLDRLFGGMKALGDVIDDRVIYLKYEPDGRHNVELLRNVGIPVDLEARLGKVLKDSPHRNASPSHKQTVALLNVDALSARIGVPLSRASLQRAFAREELRFNIDRSCELIDGGLREAMRDRALAAACRQGVNAYAEFFGDAEIRKEAAVDRSLAALSDGDLAQLAAVGRNAA